MALNGKHLDENWLFFAWHTTGSISAIAKLVDRSTTAVQYQLKKTSWWRPARTVTPRYGPSNPFYGRKHSAATRRLISAHVRESNGARNGRRVASAA